MTPPDDFAFAHLKDDAAGHIFSFVNLYGEEVPVGFVFAHDLLFPGVFFEGEDAIAQSGGLLEQHFLRRGAPFRRVAGRSTLSCARSAVFRLFDRSVVVCFGLLSRTRSRTFFDVIFETGIVFAGGDGFRRKIQIAGA